MGNPLFEGQTPNKEAGVPYPMKRGMRARQAKVVLAASAAALLTSAVLTPSASARAAKPNCLGGAICFYDSKNYEGRMAYVKAADLKPGQCVTIPGNALGKRSSHSVLNWSKEMFWVREGTCDAPTTEWPVYGQGESVDRRPDLPNGVVTVQRSQF
ncbi:hypothetical protein J7I98_39280 [Streptomyces sp. ISL-98]|uniref:hypothetical protein n=1 Tax=Streptomyces sp. ISL-98 TaxID=2819192 RepID=UPI001BE92E2D|nr:hypothetical protein [Streptomyces sp. ISL-98]MBT2511719.1 hypothetical protein [Streptomyces sp. ISL-98]